MGEENKKVRREKAEMSEKDFGVHETVEETMQEAKKAFLIYRDASQQLRKKIISNIRRVLSKHNEELAHMAVEETGMGRVEDKIAKNILVLEKTPGVESSEYRPSSHFNGDYGITFLRGAPYGVIAAITPSTNPGATIINNSITMLSAGNCVVFNPHPNAKKVSNRAAMLVNQAIREAGCPVNLIFSIQNPTIDSSQQMMKHPEVKLLVVTGGPDVVRAAMASGKKVIAAGPGNPPVIVDETAEIDEAAADIVKGASFENNILCIAEKEVFVVETVADALKRAMATHNAYSLSPDEFNKVVKIIFIEKDGALVINKKYVGKDASFIAQEAGVSVPSSTRLLFGETPFEHPLVQHEQLMPVLPIVRVKDWKQAMDYAVKAEHGFHHTAMMHSLNVERIMIVSKLINTAIFIENGYSLCGLGFEGEGYTTMTIAGPTGEGVTGPWSFMRQRRYVLIDSYRGDVGHMPHG